MQRGRPRTTPDEEPDMELDGGMALTRPDGIDRKKLFSGMGGMFSFTLKGGTPAARQLIERLELAVEAPSLGGPETLVTRPATTSHAGLSVDERQRAGISDGLVRV